MGATYQLGEDKRRSWFRGEEQKSQALLGNAQLEMPIKHLCRDDE